MTDVVVIAVIAGTCVWIIRKKITDIRNGKIGCGGSCTGCGMECRNQRKLK